MPVATPTPMHQVHEALRQRLEVVFPPRLFQHDMVPPKLDAKAWAGMTKRTPFVGLGWDAIAPKAGNGRLFQGHQSWSLYLVTENIGSVASRFLGDARGIGLFHMVNAALATVAGHTIDGVGTIEVTSVGNNVSPEWDMSSQALAVIDLHIPNAFTPNAVLDDIEPSGWLKKLGIDWGFSPETNSIQDVTDLEAA